MLEWIFSSFQWLDGPRRNEEKRNILKRWFPQAPRSSSDLPLVAKCTQTDINSAGNSSVGFRLQTPSYIGFRSKFGIVQEVFSEKVSAITRLRQKCFKNAPNGKLCGRRGFFFFFLLGEGKGESEEPGGGGRRFLLKIPGGGGLQGGWGRGAGSVFAGNWGGGGGLIFFFRGRNSTKEKRNVRKCVENASEMRQKCAEHLWGEHLLDDTDKWRLQIQTGPTTSSHVGRTAVDLHSGKLIGDLQKWSAERGC